MSNRPPPCKYFLQGNCKYGNQCTYSHERAGEGTEYRPGRAAYRPKYPNMTLSNTPTGNSNINNSSNTISNNPLRSGHLFATGHIDSQGTARPGRAGYQPRHSDSREVQRGPRDRNDNRNGHSGGNRNANRLQEITPESVIQHDLTVVNQQWPFTCYGITTDWSVAGNILEGIDYSPEELRLSALLDWKQTGTINGYVSQVHQLREQAQRQVQMTLSDTKAALSNAISRAAAGSTGIAATTTTGMRRPTNMQHSTHMPHSTGAQHQFLHNPTSRSIPEHFEEPSQMTDDQLGFFQLGSVPVEPPF